MNPTFVLYGTPGSLYTAKVRAYLRKQRIPFEERAAGDPRFANEVLPQIGRWIIPVLQKPEGTLVQDGALIIDDLEAGARSGPSAYPKDPLLCVIAHLVELFGGEGLLRPAMHYRWNFDDDNLAFIKADFIAGLAPGSWRWPTTGKVVAKFDADSGKKGIDITGMSGQPIFSAAAGDVVYSGNGLLGYGNLIIIKHDDIYLSAYGHNSQLLVKEGDKVTSGQEIAKMEVSPKEGATLHFEIRKEGKPVDPQRYLPKKN